LHFPPFNSDTPTRNRFNEVEKFLILNRIGALPKTKAASGDAKKIRIESSRF